MVIILFSLVIGILLFGLSIIFYHHKSKNWFIMLIVSIFLLGIVRMDWYKTDHQSIFNNVLDKQLEGKYVGIRGYIDSEPTLDGDLVKLIIKPITYSLEGQEYRINTKEKLLINLFLQAENEQIQVQNWETGMGIRLYGVMGKVINSRNPGEFNYREYLARKGIYWKLNVYDIAMIEVATENGFFTGIDRYKRRLSNIIDSLFGGRQAGFMKSILLGERDDLANELFNDFSILGLSHLLAISGLHLSILTLMLFWLFGKLRITKQNTAYIVSFLLIGYMFFTGASPSVVRATVMAILMFYGLIFKRSFLALQSFGIALMLMSFYNPMWIFDVGFQLSFVITFYILWGLPIVYGNLHIKNEGIKKSVSLIIITQLASFPLSFYYFHQYSTISWLTNLLIVPIFSIVILPFGIILLLFALFFPYLGLLFAKVMSLLLDWLFSLIQITADLRFFHFYGGFHSFFWVLVFYIYLTWLLLRKRIKESFIPFKLKKYIFQIEKTMLVILAMIVLWWLFPKNEGFITFIDVGQGDSILIQAKGNKNILIDSGGRLSIPKENWQLRKNPFNTGKNIILPYLKYRGVKKIDIAILTHEDIDHLGGYLFIADNIEIDNFVVEKGFPRTVSGEKLLTKLIENKIKIEYIDRVKTAKINEDTQITFAPIDIPSSNKENDHSFAIFLNMYNTKLLFSADIEKLGEEQLITTFIIEPVDILKVGHHGSITSSTNSWLLKLKPQDSIISVGKNNRYNHPSKEILTRLEKYSKVWRTDLDGGITVQIDSKGYKIERTIEN
ncbi:DNA internalization-related competence protein ComEC/Rec2 [Vulcanibacillus modesticaldus]|nr:DNA internalization-related competence protein ComEC/Rec2 [Vulcanibacillus modesticaldus]